MSMIQETKRPSAYLLIGAIMLIGITLFLVSRREDRAVDSSPPAPLTSVPTASTNRHTSSQLSDGLLSARDVQKQKLDEQAKSDEFARLPAEEQLARIIKVEDETERTSQLAALAKRLDKEDPNAADALVQRFWKRSTPTGNKASEYVKALTRERFTNDRDEAIAWADALPREAQTIAYLSMANQWGAENAAAATEWALGIPNQALKNHMVYTIGSGLQQSQDIRAGVEWAANLAQFDDAQHHAGLIGDLWGRGDIQATYDWALALPDPAAQKEAFVGLANALANQNPEVAKDWIH